MKAAGESVQPVFFIELRKNSQTLLPGGMIKEYMTKWELGIWIKKSLWRVML